ncbi:exodeoxyribonuclease III [Dactylosporangium roseum]|uniref:Exodeoxyribonuclease III n=1 Tax=Dactylosporangium roseum TaxID=47989 RepID=A0ABY5ZD05_9ACTN|nr:exodeoxyribonuclease III [Dactylosporangium roseum]UWZ38667.1 exodeoxyribonuclease III [Dactylosporangium roseum]
MKLATWNVNSVKARLPRLLDWLDRTDPDVLCVQETKVAADAFPAKEVAELGYETAHHGEGRWNGVALLSRAGLEDVRRGFAGDPGWAGEPTGEEGLFEQPHIEARAVSALCGGVRVWSVYVPNGRTPESAHYTYKLSWLGGLRTAVAQDLASAAPVVVCGDFNVAPTDADVFDPAAFVGSTHVTAPERAALAALREAGLDDIVPTPMKGPNPFTYWDYRAGMFHQDKGMRIDLVYASPALSGAVTSAYIDREARKGKGPSDHAPIVIDFDI